MDLIAHRSSTTRFPGARCGMSEREPFGCRCWTFFLSVGCEPSQDAGLEIGRADHE